MIKIALADDEVLFRKGLKELINDFNNMSVVLEVGDGQELLSYLRSSNDSPDVLLLDLNMPQMNGIETAKILQEDFPAIKIIVLSTYFNKAFILNLIELGASSYLPKNSLPNEVEQTIEEVMQNGFSYNKKVMEVIRENMMKRVKPKVSIPFATDLTKREQEVLQLICEELKTGEIAKKLFISPRTVDGHRNNLLQKLNCRNTAGLVVYAIQNELVEISPDKYWLK